MKNNKTYYHNFCKSEINLPIFFQDWYLDATCGSDNWDTLIIEKSGEVAAVLPYYIKSKFGFRYITMPPLTKFMGPYIIEKYNHKRHSIHKEFIKQLPKTHSYIQNFDYSTADWLAFYWNQYKQTTRYSYIVENYGNTQDYFKSIDRYYKKKILQANKLLDIKYETDINEPIKTSYILIKKTFERQKLTVPFTEDTFTTLLIELDKNKSSKSFFAINNNGEIIATAILIWDNKSAYYLISGEDPNYRELAAGLYLMYNMITYSNEVLNLERFDFLGSMIPSLEVMRRKLNAKAIPYFEIQKSPSKLFSLISKLKNI